MFMLLMFMLLCLPTTPTNFQQASGEFWDNWEQKIAETSEKDLGIKSIEISHWYYFYVWLEN